MSSYNYLKILYWDVSNTCSFVFELQCLVALQNSPLPEAAEIQDILQQIEFDGLFYTHDRLAERQVCWAMPLFNGNQLLFYT